MYFECFAIAAKSLLVSDHQFRTLNTYSLTDTAKVDITLADRSAAVYPCLISSDRKAADAVKVPPAAAS